MNKVSDYNFPQEYCVFKDEKALLYQVDCIKFMDTLIERYPDGVFDMIFADPPYFLSNGGITCHSGKMVKVDKGDWDKPSDIDKIHKFNLAWLSSCQKLLKKDGTIWVSGTSHNIYSIGFAMQQLGMKILNNIIWEKPNPPPNLSCRYFTHSTETIIWAAKNKKSKHRFNYEIMKKLNNGKQMKSVWTIPAPKRAEKTHFDYKEQTQALNSSEKCLEHTKDEKKFGKHPTQKPLELLKRIILASTIEGDLIFDPFSGSSTTGVAAIKLNRLFVGCEIKDEFIRLSVKRLSEWINK